MIDRHSNKTVYFKEQNDEPPWPKSKRFTIMVPSFQFSFLTLHSKKLQMLCSHFYLASVNSMSLSIPTPIDEGATGGLLLRPPQLAVGASPAEGAVDDGLVGYVRMKPLAGGTPAAAYAGRKP
jgi:hypothetical protein